MVRVLLVIINRPNSKVMIKKIKSKIDITNFNIRPKTFFKFVEYTFDRVYEFESIGVNTKYVE